MDKLLAQQMDKEKDSVVFTSKAEITVISYKTIETNISITNSN